MRTIFDMIHRPMNESRHSCVVLLLTGVASVVSAVATSFLSRWVGGVFRPEAGEGQEIE